MTTKHVYIVNKSVDPRFWAKVDIKGLNDCWNWTGATSRGHGQVRRSKMLLYAHRYSYILAFGPIPDDLLCLHKCNNSRCVNPNHLYLGNDSDNTRDKILDDPLKCFPKAPILCAEDILSMRKLHANGASQRKVSNIFGVCQMTVNNYIRYKQMCKDGYYV